MRAAAAGISGVLGAALAPIASALTDGEPLLAGSLAALRALESKLPPGSFVLLVGSALVSPPLLLAIAKARKQLAARPWARLLAPPVAAVRWGCVTRVVV